MSKDTGGSAFPTNTANIGYFGACYAQDGMTLRDYFAGKQLSSGIVARNYLGKFETIDQIADYCFMMADAMLKARMK
jgi:hypothetical protein